MVGWQESRLIRIAGEQLLMERPRRIAMVGQRVTTPAHWRSGAGAFPRDGRRLWPLLVQVGLLALILWATAHVIDLTTYGSRVPNGDVLEYQRYAMAFWLQHPLFHHLPLEYPPLAILPFTLTIVPPLYDPLVPFEWWIGAALVAGYFWFQRYSTPGRAVLFIAYLVLGAAATVLARFDLFPALATLLALWAVGRSRFRLAYALLAAGVLLKLYPAFLIPVVAVEQWRTLHADPAAAPLGSRAEQARALPPACGTPAHRSGVSRWRGALKRLRGALASLRRDPALPLVARGVGLCGALVALGFGAAALLSPGGAFSGFSYASDRPLQIESTPASLLWIGTWFGIPARAVYTFHSLNYVGVLDGLLKPLSALALAGGCLLVYWRQLAGRLDVRRAFVACVCVVLVTNKIFSPQYLIWVLPLVAYVEGFDLLWVGVALLTTFIYPFIYFAHPHIKYVATDWRFLPTLAVRNALLLVITARTLRPAPPARALDESAPRTAARRIRAAATDMAGGS